MFETFDLGLAAALISKGQELHDMTSEGKKYKFVFEEEKECKEMADGYWNDTVKVPARKYFDTVKMLKNRMYSSYHAN